jgi:hypothetical protein
MGLNLDGRVKAMPFDSVICRKKLDEERGNDWICGCALCQAQLKQDREKVNEQECEVEKIKG